MRVFMNNAPLTGQVGRRDRPTDRPGYVRLAGTVPNSHVERRLARRVSSAQIYRSPQILLCSLRPTGVGRLAGRGRGPDI